MASIPVQFSKTFKLAFSILFLGFFAWQVAKTAPWQSSHVVHLYFEGIQLAGWLLVVALVFPNWWLEAQRWRCLCMPFEPLDALTALRHVLSGLATGFFIPGRLGECAGRLVGITDRCRLAAAMAWAAGGMIQWSVAFLGGLAALISYLARAHSLLWIPEAWRFSALLWLGWGGGILLLFFLMARPVLRCIRSSFWSLIPLPLRMPAEAWLNLGLPALFKAGWLSAARYGVFVFQYLILLKLLGWNASLIEALQLVALTYFMTLFLPLLPVAEPAARGSLALYLFPEYEAYTAAILAAPALLWTINVAVPALMGWVLLLFQPPRKA
jgi:hypothetical protein